MEAPPRSVDEVYDDFAGRRAGVVKALTTEVEDFFKKCDPEKENLCLYGHADTSWVVDLPAEEVPPELPEPALGINFARDGMQRKDWIALVAVHSDAWLLAVAFFFGAKFDKLERETLFKKINSLPTVYEVVSGKKGGMKQLKKPMEEGGGGGAMGSDHGGLPEQEENSTPCPLCGDMYRAGEFWISCDVCEIWYHGKCVKITPAKAEHIKKYKCPDCTKRNR